MTEIEKLKKEIEDLKLIIESKNNQVESKNKHIKRLERIISNIKKNNPNSNRGRGCAELTLSKFQSLFFSDYKLLGFQAGAFAHPHGWRRIDILIKIYNILKTFYQYQMRILRNAI